MKTFEITHDFTTLARVLVDEEKAAPVIREMVDFWSDAKDRLSSSGGDYLKLWLQNLGGFIYHHARLPGVDDEGWYTLDGEHGITLLHWEALYPDHDAFEITELS